MYFDEFLVCEALCISDDNWRMFEWMSMPSTISFPSTQGSPFSLVLVAQVDDRVGGGSMGNLYFVRLWIFLGKTWFFKNTLVPALRPGVNIFAKQLDPNETINGVSSLDESWSLKDIAELPRGSLVFYGKHFIIH